MRDVTMTPDRIDGDWPRTAAAIGMRWSALGDADLARIGGSRERFAEALQARYGRTLEQALAEIDVWLARR